MSALLPKSLLSRLSKLAGLGAPPVALEEEKAAEDDDNDDAPAASTTTTAAPSPPSPPPPPPPEPPLSRLDDSALTLSLDHLSPRDLAALALASQRFRSVACNGDAWRLRFGPRLPRSVVERIDAAATEASSPSSSSSSSSSPSFGWPSTYAALALSNLLRSPLEWDGVAAGMRAATAAASEASASSPAWRVTAHGGHGWAVEGSPPAGSDEFPAPGEKDSDGKWPPALPPRSALASSRAATRAGPAGAAARLSSWLLPRALLPSSPPEQQQQQQRRPLSVVGSFSWSEIVQEVDLVFELLRATSWVSSSSTAESRGGEQEEEKEAKDDDDGDDRKDKNSSSSKHPHSRKQQRNLCWTREDAEAYLDSSPALCLSFSCASRRDCESSLSACLLALPDFAKTGPLPPYHGRANYDWGSRAQALAVSELPERAAPWGEPGIIGGSRAGTWERMTLPPLRLPPGTRRALVVFRSKDSRFWSGHYGAKLAAPVLAFAATDRELAEAEEAALETERGMEAAAAARELLFVA